jgi:sodium pump decarboxylase gamma subunit
MYEGLQGAIVLSIISIVIVFIVLGLLALLMVGLRKIMAFISKKTVEEKGIVKEEKTTPVPKEAISTEETENEEIVSVISAAVANYLHSTASAQPLSIISIKRIMPQTLNYWAITGRQNMMAERISISSRKKGGI